MNAPEFVYYEFEGHFYPVRIFFAVNEDGWRAVLKAIGVSDEPYPATAAQCTFFRFDGRESAAIISVGAEAETRSATQVIGLVAHEVVHVIQFVEDAIFIDDDRPQKLDTESEAYLMQKMLMWVTTVYAESGRAFTDEPVGAQ